MLADQPMTDAELIRFLRLEREDLEDNTRPDFDRLRDIRELLYSMTLPQLPAILSDGTPA